MLCLLLDLLLKNFLERIKYNIFPKQNQKYFSHFHFFVKHKNFSIGCQNSVFHFRGFGVQFKLSQEPVKQVWLRFWFRVEYVPEVI
jgi:hypothetical protein